MLYIYIYISICISSYRFSFHTNTRTLTFTDLYTNAHPYVSHTHSVLPGTGVLTRITLQTGSTPLHITMEMVTARCSR